MTTLSKALLAVSMIGITVGSVADVGGINADPAWAAAMPVGAGCFGAFLISLILEKEMARFWANEPANLGLIHRCRTPHPKMKGNNCGTCGGCGH